MPVWRMRPSYWPELCSLCFEKPCELCDQMFYDPIVCISCITGFYSSHLWCVLYSDKAHISVEIWLWIFVLGNLRILTLVLLQEHFSLRTQVSLSVSSLIQPTAQPLSQYGLSVCDLGHMKLMLHLGQTLQC